MPLPSEFISIDEQMGRMPGPRTGYVEARHALAVTGDMFPGALASALITLREAGSDLEPPLSRELTEEIDTAAPVGRDEGLEEVLAGLSNEETHNARFLLARVVDWGSGGAI